MEEYLGHHDLRTCHRWIFTYVKSMVHSSDTANVEQLKEKNYCSVCNIETAK